MTNENQVEASKWFLLDEDKKIRDVYSEYTIKDFWDFWSDKENKYMEVRIKDDFKLIKDIGHYFKIPISKSGVYVNNEKQLKNVICVARDKAKLWFGVNPRKRNYLEDGKISFGGGDYFVESIRFLFIDIDRVLKEGLATHKELENCEIVSNKIMERLSKEGWNKSYIKICSGNGVQILIKLDVPIKMPTVSFDDKNKIYIENDDFERMKAIVRNGIGRQIINYSKRFKDKYGCEVDSGAMKLMQVASLPFTKNFKYDSFRWRGIVELRNGVNSGLSDYILSMRNDNIDGFKKRSVFTTRNIKADNLIMKGHLMEHPLVCFLLDNNLPYGAINNKIWFSLKILLRDSKFDTKSEEFRIFHAMLERKYKGEFSTNVPDSRYNFSERVVNNYCLENGFPLVYDYWASKDKVKKMDMKIDDLNFDYRFCSNENVVLNPENNIMNDMFEYKKKLVEGSFRNKIIIGAFINGCIKKYGVEKTKYFCNNIFYKYFSFN